MTQELLVTALAQLGIAIVFIYAWSQARRERLECQKKLEDMSAYYEAELKRLYDEKNDMPDKS